MCGDVGKVAVHDLMRKYGADTTVEASEKVGRCSRCWGEDIIISEISYVGNSEFPMYISQTPKVNKDYSAKKSPALWKEVAGVISLFV